MQTSVQTDFWRVCCDREMRDRGQPEVDMGSMRFFFFPFVNGIFKCQ